MLAASKLPTGYSQITKWEMPIPTPTPSCWSVPFTTIRMGSSVSDTITMLVIYYSMIAT